MMKHTKWVVLAILACAVGLAAQQPPPAEPQKAPANTVQSTSPSGSKAPDELIIDGKSMGKRVPQKDGDICALCNQPVEVSDPVYLVRGQRVPVHAAEMAAPDAGSRLKSVLALIRPRGAFIGAEPGPSDLSDAWFFFGLYVLIGLLFGALAAHHALNAGHNPIAWFFAALVFNAFGYLALLTRPKREVVAPAGIPKGLGKIAATYSPQACPKCGATNHPSATQCLGCSAKLSPHMDSEVVRAGLSAK